MLFNSYIFVLFFLPIMLIGYFTLNRLKYYRLAMISVLGMSLWFYGFFNYSYLIIIVASILFNYGAYKIIMQFQGRALPRKILATVAVCVNIAILFYFKYYDFFIQNINILFKTNFTLQNIILPLGISFFTFQQISFIVDAYKNEVANYNLIDYACFVTYFPQLVAGPIVTHDELVPQFADLSKKQFKWEYFSKGIYAFTIGLSKKVLIADVLGNMVNWGYSNIEVLNATTALIVTLAYTIQIYFDFSGYSDMAIGIGRMMNITLPNNFNSPYKAITINDFWNRWHITLTRFFTKYVYIPLGGNRHGTSRTYINIMIVYLLSGIWHGANWTFIFWGICHGLFCVFARHFKAIINKIPSIVSWILTFVFVNFMWIFFRADSMNDAFIIIEKLFTGTWDILPTQLLEISIPPEWEFIILQFPILEKIKFVTLWGYIVFPLICTVKMKNVSEHLQSFKPSIFTAIACSILLVLCIISFSGVSSFLYFNF